MSDLELLREHQRGSPHAFAQLVRLHSGWIHAAALRRTRDVHLADDVTQATFIVLLRNAGKLGAKSPLGPWLFRVMSYVASSAHRAQARRRRHERTAAAMREQTEQRPALDSIGGEMDELLMRLKERDRQAIVLRFYQGKSFHEIGNDLGIGEDGARKRVDRAIERLRTRFSRRGGPVTAAVLTAALATCACPAPAAAAIAAGAAAINTSSSNAHVLAHAATSAMTLKWKLAAVLALALAALMAIPLFPMRSGGLAAPGAAPLDASVAMRVTDPALGGPGIAAPWPLALPGSITGTPAVADLEGDGKLCIIVPCETLGDAALLHPNPDISVRLFAFRADGSPVPGWPVVLVDWWRRQQRDATGRYSESWSSSPSLARDRSGKLHIVLSTPYFLGLRVISPGGQVRELRGGSQWSNIPLADINGDGVLDIVAAGGVWTVDGGSVPNWPADHPLARTSGFVPCIGDANRDGKVELFHLMFRGDDMANDRATVIGYDANGAELSGWPRVVYTASAINSPLVLGDVSGDEKLEVIGCFGDIHVWSWDGKPAAGTDGREEGDGILISDASRAMASPSLADLDGDGKAEIIVYDPALAAIRAWHGDGRPVRGGDGVIATVRQPADEDRHVHRGGVSVVDLGGDGVFDFFVGTYWVKFNPRSGEVSVTNMLAQPAASNWVQPSVADIDGDGNAEVIFGLRDGRVCVYRTQRPYRDQWAYWPTANGNFQRTGVSAAARHGKQ